MFEKTMVRGLLAALVAAMLAGRGMAAFIPPSGLPPHSQYQIAFVTDDLTAGTSGLESYYNAFVTADAAPPRAELPGGVTWTAITSTYYAPANSSPIVTNASDNAPVFNGVPIYNTQGQLVSTGESGAYPLWGSVLDNPILYDELGDTEPYPYDGSAWTGSEPNGTASANGYASVTALGASEPYGGDPTSTSNSWLWAYLGDPSEALPVYALSSPITVAPEPGTLTLLASALLGLGALYLRRRRANA